MKYFETGKHENTKLKEALSLGKNEIGHKSQKKKKAETEKKERKQKSNRPETTNQIKRSGK